MGTNRVLLAAVASVVAFALTGCGGDDAGSKVPTAGGGDSSTPATTTGEQGGGDEVAAYVKAQRDWVRCLRDNGVDAPDPDEKGEVDFGDGDGDGTRALKKDPKFLDASKKCADKKATVPESVENANRPELTAAQIRAARDFAACMQKNGAPDYPDPGPDGYQRNNNSGIPEWDQSSAGAQRATRVCAPISGNPTNQPPAKG
ncbi:hypothetical protein [Streptomyces europaeiscabiei]|uniref:hypothetical protein n=1 Tax=Streptomyces europaeiscabiei TaxID=146819 RepID=UPI002E2D9410|nr:hypothetical protein [Streptomyces europaeiscabiei]